MANNIKTEKFTIKEVDGVIRLYENGDEVLHKKHEVVGRMTAELVGHIEGLQDGKSFEVAFTYPTPSLRTSKTKTSKYVIENQGGAIRLYRNGYETGERKREIVGQMTEYLMGCIEWLNYGECLDVAYTTHQEAL